jgi:hypothetical protein
MKRTYPVEFVFQAVSLIVAVIVVHAFYVLLIRPKADAILAEQQALMEIDDNYVQERSVFVIIRDFEQEAPRLRAGSLLHSHALGDGHPGLQGCRGGSRAQATADGAGSAV